MTARVQIDAISCIRRPDKMLYCLRQLPMTRIEAAPEQANLSLPCLLGFLFRFFLSRLVFPFEVAVAGQELVKATLGNLAAHVRPLLLQAGYQVCRALD